MKLIEGGGCFRPTGGSSRPKGDLLNQAANVQRAHEVNLATGQPEANLESEDGNGPAQDDPLRLAEISFVPLSLAT